ncbi:MAG TPA: hypothetical protein VK993_08025 [Chthoniobacterales bacterium]|nr:hypothetical protein [Chthoniobacterales bacterium]
MAILNDVAVGRLLNVILLRRLERWWEDIDWADGGTRDIRVNLPSILP